MSAATLACRRCGSALAADDLRCPICALATPAVTEAGPRTIARILRCEGCGAAVRYVAEVGAPRCAFCAAVMRVEEPSDPVEEAEQLVPFAVSPDQAQAALRGWMKGLGFFRPSDLATASSISLKPLHWAAWIVEARASLSWAADSNAGARLSAWAPHAGQTALRFERLVVSASRGLDVNECASLTPYFDLRTATPFASDAATSGGVEHFDTQRSAARRVVVEAIHRTAIARLQEGTIPGSRFRNVRASVVLESLSTRRCALPTYVLAYRYRGRVYRALVHGQDPRAVFGHAPYSIAKIALVVGLVIFAMAVLIGLLALRAS